MLAIPVDPHQDVHTVIGYLFLKLYMKVTVGFE